MTGTSLPHIRALSDALAYRKRQTDSKDTSNCGNARNTRDDSINRIVSNNSEDAGNSKARLQ
jgi:hypothetical protein